MNQHFEDARAELLKLWTMQLYCEYDNILYFYRVNMRPPVIRISQQTATWATWDPRQRCISIAQRLIENHSWDIVIEILKHEMAHQWVSDMYGDKGAPHGELFLKGCRRFGVAEWAARATGELPEVIEHWKDRALSQDEERLLKRVEKLLALATSTNEHEALLAMQRVRELYARHNIDRLRNGQRDSMVYLILTRRQRRTSQAESMIYSLLNEFFFVRVITGKRYDAQDCCHYAMAELMGTRENVLMAEYVYHFLWNQSHSLWKSYRQESKAKASARASFVLGVMVGFREKLAKQKPMRDVTQDLSPSEAAALVLRSDAELAEWVDYRHPRLASRSFSTSCRDSGSFSAGHSEGGRLNLHRPIERSAGSRGHLLTGG